MKMRTGGAAPPGNGGFSNLDGCQPCDRIGDDDDDSAVMMDAAYLDDKHSGGRGSDGLPASSSAAALSAGPAKFDFRRHRYPYSITWSPLPGLTCCCPCIGHMGITDSRGIIYDFAGPYTIGVDDMAFGNPTRYIPLDPTKVKNLLPLRHGDNDGGGTGSGGGAPCSIDIRRLDEAWDDAVYNANTIYEGRMHNIW